MFRLSRMVCPIVVFWTLALSVQAAGRVELIVAGQNQVGGEFHQWMELLSRAGAAHVQVRAVTPTDKPDIEVQGTAERPVYIVTGVLSLRDELLLPGGRFHRSDATRIAQWIADLAQNGPPDRREAKGAFGLTAEQFQKVHDQLSPLVNFPTEGKSRGEVVAGIARLLQIPLEVTAEQQTALNADKVAEELIGLSCGTALACVVRPLGLCLVPRPRGAQITLAIVPAEKGAPLWPVGWTPEKPIREVLPGGFEFLTVNIRNVTATTAINAIAERLKVPVLLDHNALARHGIDPDKVNVSLPAGKSTYSLTLQKVLFQARLKSEVRIDEAERPFIWVTTIKPL